MLDPADGAGVSWLHRHTEVMAKTLTDDHHMALRVRVDPAKADVVRAKFAAPAAAGEGGRDETRNHDAGGDAARRRGRRKRGRAESVTLRYGQIPSTVRGVSSLYTFIAQQRGFFAREDIKLDYVPIAGGTDKMVAALDQGGST